VPQLPPKGPSEIVEERRMAYARVFFLGNPSKRDLELVEDDLFVFCRGAESTFHPNQRMSDVYTGRREVLQRIMEFGLLDYATLFQRYHTRGRR